VLATRVVPHAAVESDTRSGRIARRSRQKTTGRGRRAVGASGRHAVGAFLLSSESRPPCLYTRAVATPLFTLANQLTLLRMGLAPLLVVLVLSGEMVFALAVFVLAGITDLLDGIIARKGGQQTTLGAMLDPVADKILLSSAFVALTWTSGLRVSIPPWLTVTTLSRDAIIVLSVAIVNLTLERRVFYPSLLGKLSTGSQLLSVGAVLLLNVFAWPVVAVRPLFALTLALTVASALQYVYLASSGRGAER
jgi:cardiolipin synthase